MSKFTVVKTEKLDDLLHAISLRDGFCAICPNFKIDCPYSSGPVAENRCQEALYKYLRGEEDSTQKEEK